MVEISPIIVLIYNPMTISPGGAYGPVYQNSIIVAARFNPAPGVIDIDPVVVTVIMSDPSNVFPPFLVVCAEFMVKSAAMTLFNNPLAQIKILIPVKILRL